MRSPRRDTDLRAEQAPIPVHWETESARESLPQVILHNDHDDHASDPIPVLHTTPITHDDEAPPPYSNPSDRCALLPHRTAEWRLKSHPSTLLSTLAATVLIHERLLAGADVQLLAAAQPADPEDPLSSLATSTYSTVAAVLAGVAEGPREAHRQLLRARTQLRARDAAKAYRGRAGEAPVGGYVEAGLEVVPSSSSASSVAESAYGGSTLLGSGESGPLRAVSPDGGRRRSTGGNPFAAVAVGTTMGIGRAVGAGLKAPGVYSQGVARGFHNLPRLYGDETVRREDEVVGFRSGMAAAGKGFGYGLYDGITGLFVQPVLGAQKEGMSGFWKGFGRGVGGLACKPAAGAAGLPGHFFVGIQKSIEKRICRTASEEECIAVAQVLQGEEEMQSLTDKERMEIVSTWLARKSKQ
ncbi:Vacuolar protein sorting-associated protein 13A [Neofusicoccum parvum]|nr:Vacuolar protein sorting-associated protein 13A [Neofusicoccum parvum]